MISVRAGAAASVLFLAAVLSGSGRAAVTKDDFLLRNAGDLVDVCSAEPGDALMTAAANFCDGFAVGVFRTLQDEQAAMPRKTFCATEPLPTRSEAVAQFVAWAKSHPNVLQMKPEDAILTYLEERFPCAPRH